MMTEKLYWTLFLAKQVVGQAAYPFRSREKVVRDRDLNVRRMIRFAYRNVPYYRTIMDEAGLKPGDFRSAEDLERLPILSRYQLSKDAAGLRPKGLRTDRCLHLFTGGSTGIAVEIYHDLNAVFTTAAHQDRYRSVLREAMGTRHYRETLIIPSISSNQEFRDFYLSRTFWVNRVIPKKQILNLADPPEKNVKLINEFKPDIIHSYGSYLESLFGWLAYSGQKMHLPKILGFGADVLPAPKRKMIRDRFGIEAFSSYNSVEAQRIAYECPVHNGLHINEDFYVVRIVDGKGRNLPPGEIGEVVVSNLLNRGTVLINYRLGDLASLIPDQCSCGRSLPLMTNPVGRVDDMIRLADGNVIHPIVIHEIIFKDQNGLIQYQVVQETPREFLIRLVVSEESRKAEIREKILSGFLRVFGDEVKVDICFVDFIPRTKAGKIRPIISKA